MVVVVARCEDVTEAEAKLLRAGDDFLRWTQRDDYYNVVE